MRETFNGVLPGAILGPAICFPIVWLMVGADRAFIAVAIGVVCSLIATPLVIRWLAGRRLSR